MDTHCSENNFKKPGKAGGGCTVGLKTPINKATIVNKLLRVYCIGTKWSGKMEKFLVALVMEEINGIVLSKGFFL